MHVLRRSARKSRMERIKNEEIKDIMVENGKPDTKTNYVTHTTLEKEKRTPKENVDGNNTSSQEMLDPLRSCYWPLNVSAAETQSHVPQAI